MGRTTSVEAAEGPGDVRTFLARNMLKAFVLEIKPGYRMGWVHEEICDALDRFLFDVVKERSPRLMIMMPPRSGKLVADSTPVLTAKGWTTHGGLKPGDEVFGVDGKPTAVVAVGPPDLATLEVVFTNGERIKVHPNHEWTVERRDARGRPSGFTVETRGLPGLSGLSLPTCLAIWHGGRYVAGRHAVLVKEVVEAADPEPGRCVQVAAPDGLYMVGRTCLPTHNSEIVSKCFPAYVLGKYPDMEIMAASYSSDLASQINRSVQKIITGDAYRRLYPDTRLWAKNIRTVADDSYLRNSSVFEVVGRKGSYRSAGVGGAFTGMGGNCAAEGTLVATPDGEAPIETLRPGDEALSWNHEAGAVEVKTIKATRRLDASQIVRLRFGTGSALGVTPEHPVWSGDEYRQAGALAKGAPVLLLVRPGLREVPQGRTWAGQVGCSESGIADCSMERYEGRVYDIQVEGNENFFANGVLVHNCLIMDDPIKNRQEADSPTYRNRVWDWYASTFFTRLSPGGGIILIQTRWHMDDLAGRLLEQDRAVGASEEESDEVGEDGEDGEDGERWRVMSFPAIAEADEPHRREGEALHPSRYGLKRLAAIKRRIGSREWESLYQQRPSPDKGQVFKKEWIRRWVVMPPLGELDLTASWDMTFKDTAGSDYVAGQVWGRRGAEFFLLDQTRGRMDFTMTVEAMRRQRAKWPGLKRILVEDAANGPAVVNFLKREIGGIIPVSPTGGKVSRAFSASPSWEAGNVIIPDQAVASWSADFESELLQFPVGAHDDQVDAMTQAIARFVADEAARHETRFASAGRRATADNPWGGSPY